MTYPTTPDGRYFLVKGRLWRCTNPNLPEAKREQLVKELMAARRAVKSATNDDELSQARQRVNEAKVALGERGPVWWTDGEQDYNRHLAKNTPYAQWERKLNID